MKTYTSIVLSRFTCLKTGKTYEKGMLFIADEERTEQVLSVGRKPFIRIVKSEIF